METRTINVCAHVVDAAMSTARGLSMEKAAHQQTTDNRHNNRENSTAREKTAHQHGKQLYNINRHNNNRENTVESKKRENYNNRIDVLFSLLLATCDV